MSRPPDPNGKGAADPHRSALPKNLSSFAGQLNQTNSNALQEQQARSALELQIFCLTRRCALTAPIAEMLAPLVYGSLRT